MKKNLTFLFLLFSFNAQSSVLTCKESCQYWDNFERRCDFVVRCEVNSTTLRTVRCEKFDNFEHKCLSEEVTNTFYKLNPYLQPPVCTEKCQYFDNFSGQCLFRTECAYDKGVMRYTQCDKWDAMDQKCDFVIHSYTWNVY